MRSLLVAMLGLALAAVVLAVPDLGSVRSDLRHIDPWWVAAAIALEVGSCMSFVVVFRAFFREVTPSLGRRIAWIETGSGALLPGGGITSYVLGGVLLRRDGMTRRTIIVRSGGLFWLTTAVNAAAALVGAAFLLGRVGGGPDDFLHAALPVIVVVPLTVLIASTPILIRREAFGGRLSALVDGVADAWRVARHPSWRLLGAVGYLGLDMAVLLATFRGLGYHPGAGVLILGYLVGYLAAIIPIPGAIGVLEGGLAGALVLYGAPASKAAAAVLVYHAIAFWVPSLGGAGAYAALVKHNRSSSKESSHVTREDDPPADRAGCGGRARRAPALRDGASEPRPAERADRVVSG